MKLTKKQTEIRGVRRFALVAACAAFGLGTCASAMALSMHVDAASAASGSSASSPSGPVTVSPSVMAGNKS